MLLVLLSISAMSLVPDTGLACPQPMAKGEVPSDGDLMWNLANCESERFRADINADGMITDMEFDIYKREAQALASDRLAERRRPSRDPNRVGDTEDSFEPCELFEDTKCLGDDRDRRRRRPRDCERQDGYYYIDDRDRTVYCPSY